MEAAGQHVQQEVAHELVRSKRHRLVYLILGTVVLSANRHAALVHGKQAPVRDRDPMRVA